jgi:dUTP pyrophosphatase
VLDIKIKLLNKDSKIPTYSHEGDACFDLYANKSVTIYPRQITKVPLGIASEIPEGYRVDIVPRSGLAQEGISIANTPGTVDYKFRGEWCVLMYSISGNVKHIEKGDRVAQGRLEKCVYCDFNVVEELTETDRGVGGFGSTGK